LRIDLLHQPSLGSDFFSNLLDLGECLAFGIVVYWFLLVRSPGVIGTASHTLGGVVDPRLLLSETALDPTRGHALLNLLTEDVESFKTKLQPLCLPDLQNRFAFGFQPFMARPSLPMRVRQLGGESLL